MSLMTEEQQANFLAYSKKFTEELIAKGPEACIAFLAKIGICYEDGSLHENYGGEPRMKLVAVYRGGEIIPFVISYCEEVSVSEEGDLLIKQEDEIIVITKYDYFTEFEGSEQETVDIISDTIRKLNQLHKEIVCSDY